MSDLERIEETALILRWSIIAHERGGGLPWWELIPDEERPLAEKWLSDNEEFCRGLLS